MRTLIFASSTRRAQVEVRLEPRMKNPVLLLPEVLAALLAIDKIVASGNLPSVTRELVDLRASQINGCSVCVDIHSRELKNCVRRTHASPSLRLLFHPGRTSGACAH